VSVRVRTKLSAVYRIPDCYRFPSAVCFRSTRQAAGIVFFVLAATQFVIGSYLEPLISGSALAISPTVVTFTVVL